MTNKHTENALGTDFGFMGVSATAERFVPVATSQELEPVLITLLDKPENDFFAACLDLSALNSSREEVISNISHEAFECVAALKTEYWEVYDALEYGNIDAAIVAMHSAGVDYIGAKESMAVHQNAYAERKATMPEFRIAVNPEVNTPDSPAGKLLACQSLAEAFTQYLVQAGKVDGVRYPDVVHYQANPTDNLKYFALVVAMGKTFDSSFDQGDTHPKYGAKDNLITPDIRTVSDIWLEHYPITPSEPDNSRPAISMYDFDENEGINIPAGEVLKDSLRIDTLQPGDTLTLACALTPSQHRLAELFGWVDDGGMAQINLLRLPENPSIDAPRRMFTVADNSMPDRVLFFIGTEVFPGSTSIANVLSPGHVAVLRYYDAALIEAQMEGRVLIETPVGALSIDQMRAQLKLTPEPDVYIKDTYAGWHTECIEVTGLAASTS